MSFSMSSFFTACQNFSKSVFSIVCLVPISSSAFVLSPIVFWWSPFISLDMVKTFTISMGVIISAILILFVAMKEKTLSLPPKSLCVTSVLVIVSIFISSILSIHFTRSFFGQIFEVGNGSFIILLFIAAWVSFVLVKRQKDRAMVLYVGMVSSYSVIFILHFLRIVFGQKFMSLGILNTSTMTILGNWFSLSIFSVLILIVSMFSIMLLKLSPYASPTCPSGFPARCARCPRRSDGSQPLGFAGTCGCGVALERNR
jgi:hypothetical protein